MTRNSIHPNVSLLQERILINFKNPLLALESLVHPSFKNESGLSYDNERLEFLGDAILNAVVGDYLFKEFPNASEGILSGYRCQLVSANSCALLAEKLNIGELLILGKGEQLNAERGRESAYANLFEAVIGAVYLDQDFETTKKFIVGILPSPKNIHSNTTIPFKNKLQEYSQKHFGNLPQYEIAGPYFVDDKAVFRAVVAINGHELGQGCGTSKKAAANEAAQKALEQLAKDHDE